jgi:hypothetical protein
MSMKEDILEQLVDDYLQSEGYFTRHNIKFRPRRDHPEFVSKQDSNHSDIDVIGIHPKKSGHKRVMVVSCKSWQSGFRVDWWLENLTQNRMVSRRAAWQFFRELIRPKWSEALIDEVERITGTRKFTYVLAVTAVVGDRQTWEAHPIFAPALSGNPMRILDLTEILDHISKMSTTTVAASQIGRVLQLMKAAEKGRKALLETVQAQSEED